MIIGKLWIQNKLSFICKCCW